MKEAVIIDLEGNDTFKRTLVADHVTGVFPIMELAKEPELEMMNAAEEPQEPETILVGYTVAVPVPEGLFKPRYDLEAWQAALEQYERDKEAWKQEQKQWGEESEVEPLPLPAAPDLSSFWVEGLSQEEIEEIRNRPQEPSPTDLLGQELAQMKLKDIQQQQVINSLGAELTAVKLDLINLKGAEGQ